MTTHADLADAVLAFHAAIGEHDVAGRTRGGRLDLLEMVHDLGDPPDRAQLLAIREGVHVLGFAAFAAGVRDVQAVDDAFRRAMLSLDALLRVAR